MKIAYKLHTAFQVKSSRYKGPETGRNVACCRCSRMVWLEPNKPAGGRVGP